MVIMKFKFLLLLIIPVLIFSSCATSGSTADAERIDELLIENPDLTLKDYLRRLSGINISESGGEVRVMIRGAQSISGDNSPLFIVDGTQVGTSFSAFENSVSVRDIESIRVVRSSEAMTTYGMRASNGAIVVYTRN